MSTAVDAITGSTRVCLMIGGTVRQVKTPSVFNRWTRQNDVDAVMVPLAVSAAGVAPFLAALRHWDNCPGAIVTHPHKQAVFGQLDQACETSAFLHACNVVRREADGSLSGFMTDGRGYAEALAKNGIRIEGADVLLIGAGAAGSAIAHELGRRGAARFVVINPDQERRRRLLDRLAKTWPDRPLLTEPSRDFRFDIVCNASPLGMSGDIRIPYPVEALPQGAVVTDVVPDPPITPFLAAAQARGLTIQTGPEMIEGQFPLIIQHLLAGRSEHNATGRCP